MAIGQRLHYSLHFHRIEIFHYKYPYIPIFKSSPPHPYPQIAKAIHTNHIFMHAYPNMKAYKTCLPLFPATE